MKLAFSEEELKELEKARNKEIVFEEDCPETTPERALKFKRVNPPRDVKRALEHISPSALIHCKKACMRVRDWKDVLKNGL